MKAGKVILAELYQGSRRREIIALAQSMMQLIRQTVFFEDLYTKGADSLSYNFNTGEYTNVEPLGRFKKDEPSTEISRRENTMRLFKDRFISQLVALEQDESRRAELRAYLSAKPYDTRDKTSIVMLISCLSEEAYGAVEQHFAAKISQLQGKIRDLSERRLLRETPDLSALPITEEKRKLAEQLLAGIERSLVDQPGISEKAANTRRLFSAYIRDVLEAKMSLSQEAWLDYVDRTSLQPIDRNVLNCLPAPLDSAVTKLLSVTFDSFQEKARSRSPVIVRQHDVEVVRVQQKLAATERELGDYQAAAAARH